MFKKALGGAVVICLATGFILLNSVQGADLSRGKALYSEKCVGCHGPKGDGKGQLAVALNPKPADFAQPKFWETPNIDQKMAEVIKNGKGQMRPNPDLSPDDIQSIILYITQTFKPS